MAVFKSDSPATPASIFRCEPRNIEQRMVGEHAHQRRATYVCARRFAIFIQYKKSTDVLSSFLLTHAIRLLTVRKPSNLILSYAFNTFATMRHICVTLLIIHIRVQVDYQLFIYQLLIIYMLK